MADLSRTFDNMPHKLLIFKLSADGLSLNPCKMITSYMCNSIQRVKLGEFRSEWTSLKKGFPQGSGLGPILYNIFSNDLFFFIVVCHLYNYADDNTLTCSDPDPRKVLTNLEKDTRFAIKRLENSLMKLTPRSLKLCFSVHQKFRTIFRIVFMEIILK